MWRWTVSAKESSGLLVQGPRSTADILALKLDPLEAGILESSSTSYEDTRGRRSEKIIKN
jgi:hypothetical protein